MPRAICTTRIDFSNLDRWSSFGRAIATISRGMAITVTSTTDFVHRKPPAAPFRHAWSLLAAVSSTLSCTFTLFRAASPCTFTLARAFTVSSFQNNLLRVFRGTISPSGSTSRSFSIRFSIRISISISSAITFLAASIVFTRPTTTALAPLWSMPPGLIRVPCAL